MFLAISRAEFADLEAKLNQAVKDHNHEIKSYQPTSDVSGMLITKDVALDFNYDPTFQRLSVAIGKKFSLAAKIAPHQVIESHILEVIHNLEPAVIEVSESDIKSSEPATSESVVLTGEQLKPSPEDLNSATTTNQTGFKVKPIIPADPKSDETNNPGA